MKQILITLLLLLLMFHSFGQFRLEPADSITGKDWFKEHPRSLLLYSSIFPDPILNTGYNGMKEYLESQGLKQDKFFNQFLFGLGARFNKIWFDGQISFSSSNNVEKLANDNTVVNFDTDFVQIALSFGCIVFSNQYVSIVPRLGVGVSEYTLQYNTHGRSEGFDFNDPSSFNVVASPKLIHENIYLDLGLDILNGLQGKKRGYIFQGGRIGYRRGLNDSNWFTNYGTLTSSLSDQMEQIYVSAFLGFSLEFNKNQ